MAPVTPTTPEPKLSATFVRPDEHVAFSSSCRLKTRAGRVDAEVFVLTHKTEGEQEAGVVVVQQPTGTAALRILRAVAITDEFEVTLSQIPPSPTSSYFAQSSKPRIELTLGAKDKFELQFPAGESFRIQLLVRELRKAARNADYDPASHSWLAFYPLSDEAEVSLPSTSAGSNLGEASADEAASSPGPSSANRPPTSASDEDLPNPYAPGFSRHTFLRNRLYAQQDKWSSQRPVSVRVVTYNVNDRVPPPGTKELAATVGYGQDDIIVVGLQEADLRSSSLLVAQGADRADAWEEAIFASLGDRRTDYDKVMAIQYVGVFMTVLMRSEIRPEVRMTQEASRGIGLLGIGGNKAGVAVRLKVFDTTLCFVNSHLAAMTNQLERRRYDYQALRGGLSFSVPDGLNPSLEPYFPPEGQFTLDHCDVLFWCGDLNYRVELEDNDIYALVEAKDWHTILHADQLLTDIADGLSFAGFSEPPINFKPTFKYVHGSTTYDPKRAPAYTDRVLYRATGATVTPVKYMAHDLLWSDHLPVSSTFSVDARVVDDARRGEVLAACQRELDKLEEIYRPRLTVASDEVHFGNVKYRQLVRREVLLQNNGRVDASYSFRAPGPNKPICAPWFWSCPTAGTVKSGESATLVITACVDETMAPTLTAGGDMNDVLVLQVQSSKDSFLSLRATFLPTLVGLPLELPQLPDVIRNLPMSVRKTLLDPIPRKEDDTSEEQPKNTKPPQEIWQLLEYIMAEGVGVVGLWTTRKELSSILDVLEAVDTGAQLPKGQPQVAAQTLLHIIASLPGHLVPRSLQAACKSVTNRVEAYGVVEQIPGVNANILIGLLSVVKLCSGDSAPRRETISVLTTAIFGPGAKGSLEQFVQALLDM